MIQPIGNVPPPQPGGDAQNVNLQFANAFNKLAKDVDQLANDQRQGNEGSVNKDLDLIQQDKEALNQLKDSKYSSWAKGAIDSINLNWVSLDNLDKLGDVQQQINDDLQKQGGGYIDTPGGPSNPTSGY